MLGGGSFVSKHYAPVTPPASIYGPASQYHFSNSLRTTNTYGFNVLDTSGASTVGALPEPYRALIWCNQALSGATSAFQSLINSYTGVASKIFGFYIIDEAQMPGAGWGGNDVSPANIKACCDYVHATIPTAKTFIVVINQGSSATPYYPPEYNNIGIDCYALDLYPWVTFQNPNPDWNFIDRAVAACKTSGVAPAKICPMYQAYGGAVPGDWTYTMLGTAEFVIQWQHWKNVLPSCIIESYFAWVCPANMTANPAALSTTPSVLPLITAENNQSQPTSGGNVLDGSGLPSSSNYVNNSNVTTWSLGNMTAPNATSLRETTANAVHSAEVGVTTSGTNIRYCAFVDIVYVGSSSWTHIQVYDQLYTSLVQCWFDLANVTYGGAEADGDWASAGNLVPFITRTTAGAIRCGMTFTVTSVTAMEMRLNTAIPPIYTESYTGATGNGFNVTNPWVYIP